MTRRSRNSRRGDSAPGWVWMAFGLALGLIVAIFVYLRAPVVYAPEPAARSAPAAEPRATPPAASATARREETEARQPENRFEFYEILPQVEVEVPDERAAAATRPRPAAAPGSYLLQAGSLSAAADADRLQANLALLGFESHVQRVQIDAAVFHRVRIGPFDDLAAAKEAQRRLRAARIDALLMQVPK
jgi:cell division protein FtsN